MKSPAVSKPARLLIKKKMIRKMMKASVRRMQKNKTTKRSPNPRQSVMPKPIPMPEAMMQTVLF